MTISCRSAALAAALILVGVASRAQSNAIALATSPDIVADQMETTSNGWYHAEGHVWIRYADHELRADKVDLNQTTGEVLANGHIELFRKGMGRWSGDALRYNYISKEGLTGASEVSAGHFNITADETRRDTNGTLHLRHARMTTCTNDVEHWHYWIAGERIDYREKDRVTVYDAVPYFMGVPIFYLPYATRDLNHPFGPRILPGYRSKWGAYLLTTYTYPIYDPPGPDELYGNVLLDFRSSRGVAYGHELDWAQEQFGKGRFGFYEADDIKANGKDASSTNHIDSQRYRLYFQHEADPTPNDQVLVAGEYLSDVRMLEDFFPETFRETSQPDNFIAYTHRGLDYAYGADVAGPLNKFYDGVGRLPEGWLNFVPQELFPNSGLYYESSTRAGYYAQQWAQDDSLTNQLAEPDSVRIHSLQKLTYPFHVFDVVSIVPRAAYDYTFYSHLADGRTNEVRSVFETGVEASFKAYSDDYGNYRHIIEPYLDYSLIPPARNVGPGDTYFFDRVDGPRDWADQFGIDGNYEPRRWDGVRPGVRNSVQTRDADGTVRTVFDWDTFVAYRFGGTGDTNGLMLAGWDLCYRPYRGLTFRTEGLYDTKEDRTDSSDTSITLGEGTRTQVELGYFRSDPVDPSTLNPYMNPDLVGTNALGPASLARGSVTHRFSDMWSGNLFMRYDLKNTDIDEIGGYLQYELDCVSFRLTTGYLPAYTQSDGTHRAVDYRIALLVWIKALQPDNVDRLRGGWGAPNSTVR